MNDLGSYVHIEAVKVKPEKSQASKHEKKFEI